MQYSEYIFEKARLEKIRLRPPANYEALFFELDRGVRSDRRDSRERYDFAGI
jgi:hypothetical protein